MSREMRKPIRPTIRNKVGKRVRLNVMWCPSALTVSVKF